MLKVKQKTWNGKMVTESVADAVQRKLNQAGGHGYGQAEQLQADLSATQEMLVRLIDVIGPSLDEDEIYQLLAKDKSVTSYDHFEVVEEPE